MSASRRLAAAAVAIAVVSTGCTRGNKRAEPAPASTTATVSATPDPSDSAPASESPTPPPSSPAPTSSVSATSAAATTSAPAADQSTTATAPASAPAGQGTPTAAVDSGQIALARSLLVTGADLGPAWVGEPVPADDEQGDVCGTVTAAAKNRMLAVSTDLSNANVEGAGRHEIARYQPGAAAGAAAAMIGLLAHCTKIKQDFDGQPAEVSATAIGPNIATFSLKFGSGAVNYGALAITAAGDYLSVSATYAGNAKAAGSLAGKLDAAARKKLTARGL